MTNLEGKIQLSVAPLYSLRNWIEYGFKQVKNELGWADFRVTDYISIERWWELVMSSYLLVSIQANYFNLETVLAPAQNLAITKSTCPRSEPFIHHRWWEEGTTWKSTLNNLRLIVQPDIFYCLIKPWLQIFKIPGFRRCFLKLIDYMNEFQNFSVVGNFPVIFKSTIAC